MASRDHLMGYMPVLDATHPLPPRKPPPGPRPRFVPRLVPGRLTAGDEAGAPKFVVFRRYPRYETVRGVPSAANPLGYVGYDVEKVVVVDNDSTVSGMRLLMDAAATREDALVAHYRRVHAQVLQLWESRR